LDDDTVSRAAALVAQHCQPTADQRGPVDYKRHLAGELTRRALRRAAARAAGEAA
jgi:carbon-monoxide dehydrogenase medium subunit